MCQYFNVDWEHDPFEPTEEDVERWRLEKARYIYAVLFDAKAVEAMVSKWPSFSRQ